MDMTTCAIGSGNALDRLIEFQECLLQDDMKALLGDSMRSRLRELVGTAIYSCQNGCPDADSNMRGDGIMRGKRQTIAKLYVAIGSIELDETKSVQVRLENPVKLLESVQPSIAAIANDIKEQHEFVDETGVAHSIGPAPDDAALHALATAIGDATHGKVLVLATPAYTSTVSTPHP